jgi:hypothetical protein
VLGDEHAALVVELLDLEAALDLRRSGLGESGDAGVALLLAPVPLAVAAVRVEDLGGELIGLGLGLLEADDVGLLALEPLAEALLPGGADAVDVPADELQATTSIVGITFIKVLKPL